MKGIIIGHTGDPNPNSYSIQGEDGKTYFAHIGDLQENEQILYKTEHEKLEDGDAVEFDIPNQIQQHVIHVKKID